MTTSHLNDVYTWAHYYDIVFKRDINHHIRFFHEVFEYHAGRKLQSLLDVACGPGYHAQEIARQGLRGVGLDLSHQMLELGRQQSVGLTTMEFLEADMTNFHLDEAVDMAVCMFDGIDLMTSQEAAINHFTVMADNLTAGGLYLIERTHPRISSPYHLGGVFTYRGARDGVEVEFDWALNEPVPDIVTGIAEIHMQMRINEHGERKTIFDKSYERTMAMGEVQLIAEHVVKAWKIVGYYGDYTMNQPLDWTPNAKSMITVLQKR